MIITAIVLNYKNYIETKKCILSLKKQILPKSTELQILIIDNGSRDDHTEKLQKEFPQYQYIYNKENCGFAGGVNQGIKLNFELSEYFLLVNNDASLEPNCLNLMLETSKEKAVVGPAIYFKNKPNIIWQGGGFFLKLKMNINILGKNKKLHSPLPQEVDFLSGCVLLIPKNIINLVGYFDERFFFYGEDLDFCLRAKKKGVQIIYVPGASAWHSIREIAKSRTSPFVLRNLSFSYFLIIRKHFPNFKVYGLLLFIILYIPFRLYQIINGGNNWRNIYAWIDGGIKGYRIKI